MPRRTHTRTILALLLAASSAACSIAGAPLHKAVELSAEGGTKPLRDELRPIRGTTRALVFAIDGIGYDDLHRALDAGRMPRTAALMGPAAGDGVYRHAWSSPDVLSVLPSTTLAAWTAVFTGEPPARTGVPGNEWWDRGARRFLGPAPVSFHSNAHAVRVYTDGLVDDAVHGPTLFERLDLRSHVSMLHLHRGADLLQLASVAQLGDLFEQMAEDVLRGGARDEDVYRESDETSVGSVLSDLRKHGIPDLQVVYLGGLDLVTHDAPDPLERQQRYLADVIDPIIGRVLDAYAEGGALDDTYVVLVADHGHTPTLADERHALHDAPAALLRAAGFRVRPFGLGGDDGDFQAVLAYQGAMAYVSLADRATCPDAGDACDWTRPAREEDVLAAARAFHAADRTGAHVPALRGTLDLLLARVGAAPGRDAPPFQVFDGTGLVPLDRWLAEHPRPDLLRLDARLRDLAAGPHGHAAGDVLLLARTGTQRPPAERFYFGADPYHSWHGGAHAEDSRVPFIIAHPRRTGAALRDDARPILGSHPTHAALTPLLLRLLDP